MDVRLSKQGDNTIDFMKFVFSIFVVAIHMGIFGRVDLFGTWFLSHWLFRPAVPFFFVVSGYYLGKKLWNSPPEKIKYVFRNYRTRIVPALVAWGGGGIGNTDITVIQGRYRYCNYNLK